MLSEYDLTYVPQKAVKGQVLADFLAAHPIPDDQAIIEDLPDEEVLVKQTRSPWQMYFDGASKSVGAWIGIVFISPQKDIMPYSFYLGKRLTNNAAEYEALIVGLQLALDFGIDQLDIYGDSELVIRQLTTEYEVRQSNLRWYYDLAQRLLESFSDIKVEHVPRNDNVIADALANTLGDKYAGPPIWRALKRADSFSSYKKAFFVSSGSNFNFNTSSKVVFSVSKFLILFALSSFLLSSIKSWGRAVDLIACETLGSSISRNNCAASLSSSDRCAGMEIVCLSV